MIRYFTTFCLMLVSLYVNSVLQATEVTVDFEEFSLAPESFYNGSDFAGDFISSQGATFNNQFTDFGGGCCWSGWSYSNMTDTTTVGFGNQYSAYVNGGAGGGANGSTQYGVVFDGAGPNAGVQPVIELPAGSEPVSMQVTNTTYAALSMLNGDSFVKKFGGPTGNDKDWFLLHIDGLNVNNASVAEIEIYLANYQFDDNSQDFILDEWTTVDLTPLQNLDVTKLALSFSSSDNGQFGINIPVYAAIDDLILETPCLDPNASDFNSDCFVDQQDLALWTTGFGQFPENNALPSDGDADEDGDVDGADFLVWQREFGLAPLTSQALAATVPEPTTLALFSVTLAVWFATRKHRCIFLTTLILPNEKDDS